MKFDELTTAEGRALGLFFALPGALAGCLLWLLVDEVGASEATLAFAVPLLLFGTGAWTLATTPDARGRSALFAVLLGLVLGLLGWSAWTTFGESGGARALLTLPVIGWIALAFYRSFAEAGRPAHYPSLFATAWNLPVVLAVAGAFTCAAYGLLWLLAALFGLIGIDALTTLLAEPAVSSTLIGALGAAAVGTVRRQEAILLTLRGVAIALLRVLAPVFALGTLLFSLALLVQGLDSLWEGWSPVVLIVATIWAGVVFVNVVVQDEDAAGGLVGLGARVQCLVLPVLAGLAAYGMWLRIDAHGLTPDRLVALVVVGFAAAYAPIYAVAATVGGWPMLRGGNVAVAALLALVGAWTLTPLFAAYEWSARDQLARLAAGEVTADGLDYRALAFDMGEPGRAALARLAEGDGPAAERARESLEAEHRYDLAGDDGLDERRRAYLAAAQVRPEGAALPEALTGELAGRIYETDLNADGMEEVFLLMPSYGGPLDALLWVRRAPGMSHVNFELWREASNQSGAAPVGARDWYRAETYYRSFASADEAAAFMEAARTAPFGPVEVTIIAPGIDGEPLLTDERQGAMAFPVAPSPPKP